MAKNKLSIYLIKQDFPVGEIIPPASDDGNRIVELQVKGNESYSLVPVNRTSLDGLILFLIRR